MFSKYNISTTKSDEVVKKEKEDKEKLKENVERPKKFENRPRDKVQNFSSERSFHRKDNRNGNNNFNDRNNRNERNDRFNRSDRRIDSKKTSSEEKFNEPKQNIKPNDDTTENIQSKQKRSGAYFNHSFDDFQKAIDSRDHLSSNNKLWFNKLAKESLKVGNVDEKNVPFKSFTTTYEKAYELIKTVTKNPSINENYVDPTLIQELLERGTFSDKLKTRASQIIENPLGSLDHLDELLTLFESRRNVDKVIYVLRDLFQNYLMPYRALIPFKERPLKQIVTKLETEKETSGVPSLDIQLAHASLIFWYFEDAIKNRYNHFLSLIDDMVSNPYNEDLQLLVIRVLREFVCLIPESRHIALSILIRSIINPSIQLQVRRLLLQIIDANAFWYCPDIQISDLVRELLRSLYTNLSLEPLRAIPRVSSITNTLKHIPVGQHLELHSVLLDAYTHAISGIRLMGRSRSFLDEGNPIYSKGMANIMKGLEKLLVPSINKERFFEILEVILSIGEIKVLETQLAVLRLFYRAKVSLGSLPESVDKYLYRRLFSVTMTTGFHSVKVCKTLSNLLFSIIVNDTDESRAVALFKRMLQSTFGQVSIFTAFMIKAVFRSLEEKPQLWKYIKTSEASRISEDDNKLYQLHGGNPSFLNAEKSSFWELILLRNDVNPTISGFIKSLSEDSIPNSNKIAWEALHYSEVLRTLLFQGYSSTTKRAVKSKSTESSELAKSIVDNTKDLWGFGTKYTSITKADKPKKIDLSSEYENAVDDILYSAEGEDDENAYLEIEEEAEPNSDDLVEAMENTKAIIDDDDVEEEKSKREGFFHREKYVKTKRPLLPKVSGYKRKERSEDGRNGKKRRRNDE